MYKFITGLSNINHTNVFQQTSKNRYNTRNFDPYDYDVKFAKQDYLKNSYFYGVVPSWNKLPEHCKTSFTIYSIKTSPYNFYLDKRKMDYVLPDGKM